MKKLLLAWVNHEYRFWAIKVVLFVGSLLLIINHSPALLRGEMILTRWESRILTYTVPDVVNIHNPIIIATSIPVIFKEDLTVLKAEEVYSIIQQAANAWMTGNADAFAQLFAPDGKFIVPGNIYIGSTAIRQVAAEFAATHSNVKIEIKQILTDGHHAVVEWSWLEIENQTGRQQKAEDAIVIDFQDGLITRWREYIDSKTPDNS
jgi:uncharacterized protein (TIGR02246 family)